MQQMQNNDIMQSILRGRPYYMVCMAPSTYFWTLVFYSFSTILKHVFPFRARSTVFILSQCSVFIFSLCSVFIFSLCSVLRALRALRARCRRSVPAAGAPRPLRGRSAPTRTLPRYARCGPFGPAAGPSGRCGRFAPAGLVQSY